MKKALKSSSERPYDHVPEHDCCSRSAVKAMPQRELFASEYSKPRTRSSVTIWNLPDSIIVNILKGVHIRDLFSFRSTHSNFRDIIDSHRILWTHLSFYESWPNDNNIQHFIKASDLNNFEATIKLSVAYLYKEGVSQGDIAVGGQKAAQYLTRAEVLTPNIFPFFWIFIRPPWSPDGSCCKVQAFRHIKASVDETHDRDLSFGVALTLKLQRLSISGDCKLEEEKYFNLAVAQGSAAASFFSVLDTIPDECDKAKELEKIRLFRQIAAKDVLEAKLNLMKCYIGGQYGGISRTMAQEYVQDFFQSAKPSGIHKTFSSGHTSDISRYILVDWLVEVVGMKDFSAHTLYLAVSMFDQYLQCRRVQRSQVQLSGVAAMVISSRFLGFDILTIREAAWLTDNSYSYHDVVRMMGELVSALKGNIRVATIQDYVKVLLSMLNESGYSAMLVEYMAMLCLLQSEMGQYSPAEIAASCLLLSRLLQNHADPWPSVLQDWTGFTQDYLSLCTFHIHKKCLQEGSEVEYRDTKLQAVKMRYADANRYTVSNIEVIGHKELCRRLGVTRLFSSGNRTKAIRFRNCAELILSPRRGQSRGEALGYSQADLMDRQNAATPTVENSMSLDESVSGYDGDLEEDMEDSFSDRSDILYELNEESDLSHLADTSGEEGRDDTHLQCCQGTIACLSSMCRSRNNVTCPSTSTSPTSCMCNSSQEENHAEDSNPGLSPSVGSDSTQNVRFCIPSGSIQVVRKSARKGKLSGEKPSCESCVPGEGPECVQCDRSTDSSPPCGSQQRPMSWELSSPVPGAQMSEATAVTHTPSSSSTYILRGSSIHHRLTPSPQCQDQKCSTSKSSLVYNFTSSSLSPSTGSLSSIRIMPDRNANTEGHPANDRPTFSSSEASSSHCDNGDQLPRSLRSQLVTDSVLNQGFIVKGKFKGFKKARFDPLLPLTDTENLPAQTDDTGEEVLDMKKRRKGSVKSS